MRGAVRVGTLPHARRRHRPHAGRLRPLGGAGRPLGRTTLRVSTMATTATGTTPYTYDHSHAHVDDRSFVRKYIFSTDHKIIGIQFLIMSLTFLLLGGTLAMVMRWQLGFPGKPIAGGTLLPDTYTSGGVVLPEFYNSAVTMHGTFMVFFAIMPLLVGVFGNYLIPLKIGAPDMAFPRINMASFWTSVPASLYMLVSLMVV